MMKLKHLLITQLVTSVVGTYVANKIALRDDLENLRGSYGKYLTINDRKMCYEKVGSGDITLLLIPGLGEPSPVCSFRPLARELAKHFTVITLEPYGYGISDDTDRERTVENIAEEIHVAAYLLGLKKYVLVAHSIGGIYGQYLANKYPDELLAFVGIDTTVAKVRDYLDATRLNLISSYIRKVGSLSGIMRLLALLDDNRYVPVSPGFKFTARERKLIQQLTFYRADSRNIFQEIKTTDRNLEAVRDMKFPDSLPVLFFTASDNDELMRKLKAPENSWTQFHRELTDNPLSRTEKMKGSHYLHHQFPSQIAQAITEWLSSINKEGSSD